MSGSTRLSRCTRAVAATALAVLAASAPARAGGRDADQVYAPQWMRPLLRLEPCALSIALPVSESEHCIPWTRRESAGAAFDRTTRLVLAGGSDAKLHALDLETQALRYAAPLPGSLVSQPQVWKGRAYFGTDEAHVVGFDVGAEKKLWDATVDAEVIEPVAVDDDLVVAITGLDSVYAFKRESGEPAWVHKHPLPHGITLRGQARPLIATVASGEGTSKRVYVGHASGRVSILDAVTGRPIDELSISPDEPLGDVDADPVWHDGAVVVASQTKGVVAFDGATNQERWRQPEAGLVRLAAAPGKIVAAGAGKIVALDDASGRLLWRFTWDRGAPTRIAIREGRAFVASDRGSLYVLDLRTGRPLQTYGSGLGFAADLDLENDMMLAVTTGGHLHVLSDAFRGPIQPKSLRRKG